VRLEVLILPRNYLIEVVDIRFVLYYVSAAIWPVAGLCVFNLNIEKSKLQGRIKYYRLIAVPQ